jgi:HSP20 family protein
MARRDIDRLQGEIEELFADLWQVPRFAGMRSGFRPAVDVWLTEDPPQLVIVVELAGIDPNAIEISIEERTLTIAGNRTRPRVPGQVYQQAEIEYGHFERRVPLEQNVDTAAATAAYDAGMLRITLPVSARKPAGSAVVIVVRRPA